MILKKIMIVEDEKNIIRELEFMLTSLNYKVIATAKSGEEALQKLEIETPDIITMDVELAGKLDGIETAEIIQKKYDIPIVYLTSHSEETTIQKVKSSRQSSYLVKPIREQDLRPNLEIAFYRYQLEKLLHEKDILLQTVIDTNPNLIFVKDKTGKYVLVNETMANLYNTTIDKMVGKTDIELADAGIMNKEKVYKFIEADKEVLRTQQAIFIPEEQILFPDGKQIWIQTRKVPLTLKNDSGYILGIVENITEQKEMKIELNSHREHLRLINKILRHDLTNDLTVIKSSLGLFRNKGEMKYIEAAETYVNKSTMLIKRMRDLENFITRHGNLMIYETDKIFSEIQEKYPNIEFNIVGKAKILANDSITSIFSNIISNAIVHGKTKEIEITILNSNNKAVIKISDFGIGIPDEVKPHIFEENYKYGKTGHTGLGLYIVKKSLESIGGKIFVEDNENGGTRFTLIIKNIK